MLFFSNYTAPGTRLVNEDAIGIFEKNKYHLFVCCDGLGGHGMGDVASQLVVHTFGEVFEQFYDNPDLLVKAIEISQSSLLLEQKRLNAKNKMKTTAAALYTDGETARIVHIGDTRAYTFYKNRLKGRTLDHSVPQMLVLSRQIKEREIRNHPDRSLVLSVLGSAWEEEAPYEISAPIPLKKGHAFLLCTDGFWELIDEKEMCRQLKSSASSAEWLERMSRIVHQNGQGIEMDNNSAIAIWIA